MRPSRNAYLRLCCAVGDAGAAVGDGAVVAAVLDPGPDADPDGDAALGAARPDVEPAGSAASGDPHATEAAPTTRQKHEVTSSNRVTA
ncbi:MAG TPA: hypothetical protein VL400_06155 [Polyangiaceae bacterium]|nr:hypothetical protein [Polyangiaceae bacterium]